tara:strand:- start:450 stop:962 length:513 start_codon:yes stop_codon:yes gene_type:complete
MNTKVKKLLLIIFLLNFSFNAYSSEIIAYLDIDSVFKNTNVGKQIIQNLEKENEKNISNLKKKESELLKKEKDLINKKKIISADEFNNQLSILSSNIKLFKKNRKNILAAFEKNKNLDIKNFFDKVNPVLKQYMNDNSIKIIIDKKNVLLATDALDITDSIIDLINKKLN